jgi:hypothetical protein
MNRMPVLAALAGAWFVCARTEEPRIPVDLQEIMIPMRDGVRLQTVIVSPGNPKGPQPFLIDRTPFGVPAKEAAGRGMPAGGLRKERSQNRYGAHRFGDAADDGVRIRRRADRAHAGIKILYMSGYRDNAVDAAGEPPRAF